jgi:hypothetical protein
MKLPTGAWQRDWIRRRGGAPDAGILVRYVQTPSVFADVRIRGDRPVPPGVSSFAELTDEQLAALARQNGFAGFTTMDGDHATWHHEIDYQPAGGGADIGRIEPVGEATMFEHGLDASYVERWSLLEADAGSYLAVRLVRGGRVEQLLAVAGDHFVYARARPVALPPADSITDLIASTHATREMIIGYLDCELSYGTTRGWQIERSTLPWQDGRRLAFIDQLAVEPGGRLAPRRAAAGEAWSVPVNTFSAAALQAMFAAR